MAEKKQLSYAITIDFLYELIEESENQVAVLKLLLEGFLQGTYGSHDLMEIVIEILWANNSLLRLIDQEIETAVVQKNKKSGEEEFLLTETSMVTLQQLVLSKYYSVMDLNRRSYSLSMH